MADNVRISKNANSTPPDGTIIATDQIGDDHYQWMKLAVGADGVAIPLMANDDGHIIPLTHTEDAIHEGNHYYISGFVTLGNDVGVDDKLYVKLVTPDSAVRAHFRWNIMANGVLETNLYEGSSGGMADGGPVTPLNSDRNSDSVSAVVITSNVTVATTLGTEIDSQKVGGEDTGGRNVVGGSADRSDEIILKQDTIYLREFISTSAANIISFRAYWVEE